MHSLLNLLPLLATNNEWWILLVILGFFVILVVAIILVKRHVKIFQSDEKPKTKEEIAKEELERLLEPIEEMKPQDEENEE